jgi:hypothetical protein
MAAPKIELKSLAPNNKLPFAVGPQGPARMSPRGEVASGVENYTNHTEVSSVFTTIGQQTVLIAATWLQITMTLETAGPVAIGTRANILPVLSGAGRLLPTNVPIRFLLPRGDILYMSSNAVNRVSVQVEPFPFYDGLLQAFGNLSTIMNGLAGGIGGAVAGSLSKLFKAVR